MKKNTKVNMKKAKVLVMNARMENRELGIDKALIKNKKLLSDLIEKEKAY